MQVYLLSEANERKALSSLGFLNPENQTLASNLEAAVRKAYPDAYHYFILSQLDDGWIVSVSLTFYKDSQGVIKGRSCQNFYPTVDEALLAMTPELALESLK
jgi:hypothetical protein